MFMQKTAYFLLVFLSIGHGALFRQTFQPVDVISQNFKGIFNRLRAGHIHARDLEHFHGWFGGTRFEKIDVILCCIWGAIEDPFGDCVRGGDPDRILERIKVNRLYR